MAYKRKIIVTDLDGTLLNTAGEVSAFSCQVIKQLFALGYIFTFATGRPLSASLAFYQQLKLRWLVGNLNGTFISNPSDPNFVSVNLPINKDVLKLFFNSSLINTFDCALVENSQCTYLVSNDLNYYGSEAFRKILYIHPKTPVVLLTKKEFIKIKSDFNSLSLYFDNAAIIDEVSIQVQRICPILVVRKWTLKTTETGGVLSINALHFDKAFFVRFLAAYYLVDFSDIYVFGDAENDLEMLKITPNAFVMQNAHNNIKTIFSNHTLYSNNQDGVAWELVRLFCLKT